MEDPMLHIFCEECHHSNDISTETTCYKRIDFKLKDPSTELTYRAVEEDPLVCPECGSCKVSRELYDHAKDLEDEEEDEWEDSEKIDGHTLKEMKKFVEGTDWSKVAQGK